MAPSRRGVQPEYTSCLAARPEAAEQARLLVAEALDLWGLGEGEGLALIVTELFSNALRHSCTPMIRVGVRRMGAVVVRVGVVDRSDVMPIVRTPDGDSLDVDGRGLTLVEALSEGRWGVDRLPVGKRVWAEATVTVVDGVA